MALEVILPTIQSTERDENIKRKKEKEKKKYE
jgi:hypothetical protein